VENDFHGTEDQLELYALGRLQDSDLPRLEEHLLVCTTCREKLKGTEDFALGMREAHGTGVQAVASQNASPQTGRMWWGLASFFRRPAFSMSLAFVALLVVVGVFSNGRTKFAPSASLQLTAMRGEMPITVAAREFDVTLSDGPRDGGPFRIEVLNAMGASVWGGLAASGPAGVQFKLTQRFPQGDYFVRLYSVSGKVLREYGFRIRN
jgi:hypothetical protein